MIIFDIEKLDGLEPQLSASASIVYASVVCPLNQKPKSSIQYAFPETTVASISDGDLYYIQSILVTSSWNKNDDIFDSREVWLAKDTPEDKPTNLEHDEHIIVGHITSNWPITDSGELIDLETNIADLPEKFHILTGSVIYKGFSDPALRGRSEKLIAEIQDGIKYVSMECFFKGFDYGILNSTNGQYKTLARNNETAYLTKYLKAYGGTGEHDSYKIGRVLRDITFTGKGFVDKPANMDSIIFTRPLVIDEIESSLVNNIEKKNSDFIFSGVSNTQPQSNVENNIMSLEETQSDTVVAPVETLDVQVASDTLSLRVAELETQVAAQLVTIQTLETEKEQATQKENQKASDEIVLFVKQEAANRIQEEVNAQDEENKTLKAELETANETIAAYKVKEQMMMKKEKKNKRAASLVDQGIDSETAASIADKFESMEDDTFAEVTSLIAGKMPPWLEKIKKGDKNSKEDKMDKESDKTKKKASENNADSSLLENVEVIENISLGIGGEIESEITSTRAALADFVFSRLGKKNK